MLQREAWNVPQAHETPKVWNAASLHVTWAKRTKKMAQVVYEDPIHHLSGKISKKYRTCYNYRKRSDRKYTSVHGDRTTPVSEAELTWRQTFKEICQATLDRLANPTYMPMDQVGFRNQTKYKTLYQYVWNLMRDEIEGK